MTSDKSKPVFPFAADITFQAGDIVFATDRFGRVVYWNEEAEATSGYKAEDVMGKPYTLAYGTGPNDAKPDLAAIIAGHDFAGAMRCHSQSRGDFALYLFATAGRNPAGELAGVVFVGRDITGLWQAEAAAQASADKYRVLFENSLDSVAIADLDGKVLEANPAWLRLYGYTVENVKGMNLTDVVAPEDRSAAADAMASLRAGRLVTKTIRMRRKDGARFVVDLVASVMTVGGERRILSVTRDVTERVRAEQARSQSERMYRAVFESANDAVFVEAVDGRIIDVNRNGCELLGYTREELLRRSVTDLVPAESRGWLTHVADAILREKTFRTEAVNVHKNGRHIPVEISASTMDLNGVTVVLAIVRDITERKQAEAALAESENRYRTLFNDSLTGIYRTTPNGRILLANPTLVRLLGYDSFAELAERNLETDGSGPDYGRDDFKQRLEREGRIVGLEVRWQTRDGRTLFVRENARAVRGQDGAVLYYEGTVEDITDRKAAERALLESEEKFRSVSEQSPNMIFINNRGCVVYANRKSTDVMGYTPEEFYAPGFDFMQLIAPESAEQIKAVYARHARGEDVEPYEYTLITRGGRRIEAIITTKLIDYAGTKAILGIVTDITERVTADRALREEKERSQTYLALAGVMLVALDASGSITLLNRRACEVLGVVEAQVLGRNWFDSFVPERFRAQVKSAFVQLMSGNLEPVEHYNNPVLTAGGEERLIAWHNTLVRDGQGRLTGTLSSGEDVTEREKTLAALRESEEKYRSVVERASDGICVVQDGRLGYVNQRLAEMVGYGPEELTGKRFDEYLHPEDRLTVAARYRRRLAGEAVPASYSVRFLPRGGGEVQVEVNVAMATYGGAPAEIVLIRDVTERRKAELALRESERQYRTALDAMRDPVHVADADLRIVMVNQAFERWLRESHFDGAVLGKTVLEAFPFLPDRVRDEYRHVFDTGEPVVTEEETNIAGRTFVTETTKMPVTERGRVVRVLTVVRDVTERKRLIRDAQETADELRAVLDNSPGAIVGECDGVLVYANQRFARLFGYDSPADVIGQPGAGFDAPQDRELLAGYARLREQGKPAPTTYLYHGIRRDGTILSLEATISTYRSLGRLHVLAFIREAAPGQ
jgi:PAS domain S-box-containing protein